MGEPKSMPELGSLIMSICCTVMVVASIMNMPVKPPLMLLIACCCALSCSASTGDLANDIVSRVKA